MEATRDDSEETVVSDEKSEDYDFDNMRKLIEKEYLVGLLMKMDEKMI